MENCTLLNLLSLIIYDLSHIEGLYLAIRDICLSDPLVIYHEVVLLLSLLIRLIIFEVEATNLYLGVELEQHSKGKYEFLVFIVPIVITSLFRLNILYGLYLGLHEVSMDVVGI